MCFVSGEGVGDMGRFAARDARFRLFWALCEAVGVLYFCVTREWSEGNEGGKSFVCLLVGDERSCPSSSILCLPCPYAVRAGRVLLLW